MTILGGHNCVPGERLGSIDEFEGGRGTYIRKGFIYSSRIGKIRFLNIFFWNFESFNLFIYSSYTNNKTEKKTFIEIIRENEPPMLRIHNFI